MQYLQGQTRQVLILETARLQECGDKTETRHMSVFSIFIAVALYADSNASRVHKM